MAYQVAGSPFAAVERFRDDAKEREIWPKGAPVFGRAGFVAPSPTSSTLTWSLQWDEEGYAEVFLSDSDQRASDFDCALAMAMLGLEPIVECDATTANQNILRGWQVRPIA